MCLPENMSRHLIFHRPKSNNKAVQCSSQSSLPYRWYCKRQKGTWGAWKKGNRITAANTPKSLRLSWKPNQHCTPYYAHASLRHFGKAVLCMYCVVSLRRKCGFHKGIPRTEVVCGYSDLCRLVISPKEKQDSRKSLWRKVKTEAWPGS